MNFGKLFGFGKKKEVPIGQKCQQASLNLDRQIYDIELKIKNMEAKTNALQNEAKSRLRAGDKNGAKRCLAKKKKYVDQIKQLEGALTMMEEQKMMLESADSMRNIVTTIKQTNQVIKETNKGMSIEDLENMRDDMEDIKADQEEINNFFAEYASQDNDDVEEELENLEKEMANEAIQLPGAHGRVQNNAINQPMQRQKQQEKQLNQFLYS